jgi:GT2 family glycosyltransferase
LKKQTVASPFFTTTENLGFVATVNRGMALSQDNDVLLLNSDTEVANDWLDRLQRAAYSAADGCQCDTFFQ